MYVLVWSDNRILSDLVARNLRRRGAEVDVRSLAALAYESARDQRLLDLAIIDLDCLEPELWERAAQFRTVIVETPLVILGHAWATPARLDGLQPCRYVRKPFAINELLVAAQEVAATASRRR